MIAYYSLWPTTVPDADITVMGTLERRLLSGCGFVCFNKVSRANLKFLKDMTKVHI